MKVEFNGKTRHAVRCAHYQTPPELGTVVGRNDAKEFLTVVAVNGSTAWFAFSTTDDIKAVAENPRSVAEIGIWKQVNLLEKQTQSLLDRKWR